MCWSVCLLDAFPLRPLFKYFVRSYRRCTVRSRLIRLVLESILEVIWIIRVDIELRRNSFKRSQPSPGRTRPSQSARKCAGLYFCQPQTPKECLENGSRRNRMTTNALLRRAYVAHESPNPPAGVSVPHPRLQCQCQDQRISLRLLHGLST
jgi:hypothetical protein